MGVLIAMVDKSLGLLLFQQFKILFFVFVTVISSILIVSSGFGLVFLLSKIGNFFICKLDAKFKIYDDYVKRKDER